MSKKPPPFIVQQWEYVCPQGSATFLIRIVEFTVLEKGKTLVRRDVEISNDKDRMEVPTWTNNIPQDLLLNVVETLADHIQKAEVP